MAVIQVIYRCYLCYLSAPLTRHSQSCGRLCFLLWVLPPLPRCLRRLLARCGRNSTGWRALTKTVSCPKGSAPAPPGLLLLPLRLLRPRHCLRTQRFPASFSCCCCCSGGLLFQSSASSAAPARWRRGPSGWCWPSAASLVGDTQLFILICSADSNSPLVLVLSILGSHSYLNSLFWLISFVFVIVLF